IVLIPIHVFFFKMTHRHYKSVSDQLTLNGWSAEGRVRTNHVIVPVSGVHRAVVRALQYASSLSHDVRAVYVNIDPVATENLRREWDKGGQGVCLVVLDSPYRSLMEPLLEYVERIEKDHPEDYVTVVLPEFVPKHWWQHLFHNQHALLIKGAFLFKPNTV